MFALSKHHPGTGAWWKKKVEKKLRKRSVTDGRTKVETCHANTEDRWMTRTSRSYKHKNYRNWCAKMKLLREKYGG